VYGFRCYIIVAFCVLDSGDDVSMANKHGLTPLMHAARSGDCAVVEALMAVSSRVNIVRCNYSGHSAADIARFYRHKDVYTLLANFST